MFVIVQHASLPKGHASIRIQQYVGIITCITAPQHLVCRVVQSLHTNHMQMGIIEVFICRRLHMNTSMILICIWLICRLCTTLHTKCCGAVYGTSTAEGQ